MTRRVLVAILGSFPVAVVAGVSLGLAINLGGAISTIFFWMVWGASTYYAVREIELRRVFGRTAITYAVAAFTLPLTAAVFAATAFGEVEDALGSSVSEAEGTLEGFIWVIFGTALLEIFLVIAVVAGVFGVITGIVAILLARRLLRGQDTESRQSAGPSVGAALRRLPMGDLRRVRLDNKATVLGLALVALLLAVIAGIAVYGILVSTDSSEPTLVVAPTLEPGPPTPGVTAAPTPNPEPTYTPLPKATPYPSGDADLSRAVRNGDAKDVQAIIISGAAVNVSDTDGNPLLHLAIWRDHIDVVRILLDAGADLYARDSEGNPMLHEAVWREHTEIVSLLIEAGVDVNAEDVEGNPILHEAIWRGHTETVRILVEAGADVNAKDSEGNPMLYEAIWRNHAEIAQVLLEAGADVDARDSEGEPMLYTAVWRNHVEAVRILVEAHSDVNASTAAGESVLSVALRTGTEEIVQILRDAGAAE